MKKLLTIILLVLSYGALADDNPLFIDRSFQLSYAMTGKAWWDDSGTIQAGVNAGNYTLPNIGRPYSISMPITCPHNLNLNGQTINTTQLTDAAIKITANGVTISNGNIFGPWNFTSAPNPTSGGYGIRILANNVTIDHIHLANFASYGIFCGNYNNPTISNNLIEKTGYIGFYYDAEAVNSTGGTVYNNFFDRSSMSPTVVTEADMEIRATVNTAIDTISNWTINQNLFKMPNLPATSTAECFEVRHMTNSTISNNVCDNGSIGISVVGCARITVTDNKMSSQKYEGLEFADSHNCTTNNNSINPSYNDGILMDGSVGCKYITLNGDTALNVVASALHCYLNTKHITVNGCVFRSGVAKVVNLQKSDTLTFVNTLIDGLNFSGSMGVFLDQSPGHLTFTNGSVINSNFIIGAYNTTTSQLVDNIIGHNVNLTSTPNIKKGTFSNGAAFGTNIHFYVTTLSYPAIPPVNYGVPDFSPGAISTLPITYSSSNTAIATIISGNIHITGTGTVNITANNGDTSAVQPLIVNKTPLTIIANSFTRAYNTVNPTFTASYSGFVYGETSANLITQPTLSTTAVTGSLPGVYTITNSGATAANYTISNRNGVLTIIPPATGNPFRHFHKAVVQ